MSLVNVSACSSGAERVAENHEAALIERAKRDRAAFAVLYRRHYQAMARYLLRRTGDQHAAEDLVADVFLTALRHLPGYRPRGIPFRYWLYRIASNTANRWVRRRRRRAQEALPGDVPAPGGNNGADRPDTVDREWAQRAMLSLSPKHQAVISLHYLEEMSVEDTAAVLGCRVGTVKSRLSRARAALRERLKDRR
jgi:RNA polymerase sigma-70 factor (ECF subfamily)